MFTSPFDSQFSFALVTADELRADSLALAEKESLGSNVSPKRLQHFALGRFAAGRALRGLGLSDPIPRGSRREPIWPQGVIGSITHQDHFAIAVTGRRGSFQSVGIDLERLDKDRRSDLADRICTANEQVWLKRLNAQEHPLMVMKIFSAKESVYKAFFQLNGATLRFKDVEFSSSPAPDQLIGRLVRDIAPLFSAGYSFTVGLRVATDTKSGQRYIFSYLTL